MSKNPEVYKDQAPESSEFELQLNETKAELAELKKQALPEQYEGLDDTMASLAMMINNPSTDEEVRREALDKYMTEVVHQNRGAYATLARSVDAPEGIEVPETYAA